MQLRTKTKTFDAGITWSVTITSTFAANGLQRRMPDGRAGARRPKIPAARSTASRVRSCARLSSIAELRARNS